MSEKCPTCGWSVDAYGCYIGQCYDPGLDRRKEREAAKPKCQTPGCGNLVEEHDDELCFGCEADLSHRAFHGSGIPMSHHKPS